MQISRKFITFGILSTKYLTSTISNEYEKSFICLCIYRLDYKISHSCFAVAQHKVRDDRPWAALSRTLSPEYNRRVEGNEAI
jgi:hypothetical protein